MILLGDRSPAPAGTSTSEINDRLIESKPVTVPLVVGIKQELAEQKITRPRLTPVVRKEPSDKVKAGIVIRQSPDAGTRSRRARR